MFIGFSSETFHIFLCWSEVAMSDFETKPHLNKSSAAVSDNLIPDSRVIPDSRHPTYRKSASKANTSIRPARCNYDH